MGEIQNPVDGQLQDDAGISNDDSDGVGTSMSLDGEVLELKVFEKACRIRNITSPQTSPESESSAENSARPLSKRFIPNPVGHRFVVVPYHTVSPPFTSTPVRKVPSDTNITFLHQYFDRNIMI